MPSKGSAPFPGGATPLPNRLVDTLLPTLKDTELRVYLVVLRQTYGWREGDPSGGWHYKERDWISHAQLAARTGRRSEAVSSAVDALVRRGLLVVEDLDGQPLPTSEKRRRYLGRLYYRLSDLWKTSEPPRLAKAKTTTDRGNNKGITISRRGNDSRPVSLHRGWQRAAHLTPAKTHYRGYNSEAVIASAALYRWPVSGGRFSDE